VTLQGVLCEQPTVTFVPGQGAFCEVHVAVEGQRYPVRFFQDDAERVGEMPSGSGVQIEATLEREEWKLQVEHHFRHRHAINAYAVRQVSQPDRDCPVGEDQP
jgi:hypothetical protein